MLSGQGNSDAVRLVAQVAAVLSIGAGVIHVSAAGDHTNLPVMFAGFMVVATLQVALGALLFSRRASRLVIVGGLALMVGSIAVWVVSRTAGLPFLEDGHTEPIGFKDGVTVLFELASVPALLLLLSPDLARVSLPSPRLGSQTLAAAGALCFALMVPALLLGGGGHHSHEQAVELGIHDEDEHDDDGHELAQSGSTTSDAHGAEGDHAKDHDESGKDKRHGHAGSGTASGAQQHSGHDLASAPLDSGHDGPHQDGDAPRHDAGGKDGGDHRSGEHDKGRGKGDGHKDDHPKDGDGSDDEQPVSITYEPEPRVCVTNVCFP